MPFATFQGPVVQSIVRLKSSLRGQFTIKCTDIFVEKMREAFAPQKLLTFFFSTKNTGVFEISMFEILTKC